MSARSVRDASIERSVPWTGGSGYGGAPSSKMTLDAVPCPRCFDRGNVGALTAWLNSPAVTDALVWSVAPAAPTANRIGIIGVPDDDRSGANALLEHYDAADDHYKVLRAALSKRALPFIQAVLFDVGSVGDNAALGAISRARSVPEEYVSLKIVTLNDGSLEVDEDNNYRTPTTFVENLLCGKDWDSHELHNACVRELDVTRCASTACPSRARQTSSGSVPAATTRSTPLTEHSLSSAGTATTPSTRALTPPCALQRRHPARRPSSKRMPSPRSRRCCATRRYRAFLASTSPTASFPPFQIDSDRSVTMQAQARTAHSFALSIGSAMPSLLVASAAPAAPAAAPAAPPGGPPSRKRKGAKAPASPAKTKAVRKQRSGPGIGDNASRVTTNTSSKVVFS